MLRKQVALVLVGLFAVAALSAPANGQNAPAKQKFNVEEKPIEMAKVPEKVQAAAAKVAQGTKLTEASIEIEDGMTIYELKGKNAEGKWIEVDVSADGYVLEVETEITMEDVPQAVRDCLKSHCKEFQPKFIERSVRFFYDDQRRLLTGSDLNPKTGENVWYEFEGKDGKGQQVDVEIRSDGKKFVVELDDDVDIRDKKKPE